VMVLTYVAYLVISVGLTVWVARTLSSNGRAFLVDVFEGDGGLADSVNRLLVVGFYLINLGYVSLALKIGERRNDVASGVRDPFTKGWTRATCITDDGRAMLPE